jgi:hypothetical protein
MILEITLFFYIIIVVASIITWACDGYERTEKHFWNIIGIILVWPLWLFIKVVKGIFRGLRDTIMS